MIQIGATLSKDMTFEKSGFPDARIAMNSRNG
jgi:hypothetical protein